MRKAFTGVLAVFIGAALLAAVPLAGAQELKGPSSAALVLKDGSRLGVAPRGSDIACGFADEDTFDVNDVPGAGSGGTGNGVVYIIVVATGNLFGGPFGGLPILDPIVEVRTQGGAFIASNDDNGVGPNTIGVTGLDILFGFLPIGVRDSFVTFTTNTTYTITVRGFGTTCGPYAIYIL